MSAIRQSGGTRTLLVSLSAALFVAAVAAALYSFRPALAFFDSREHGGPLGFEAAGTLLVCGLVWFRRGRLLLLLDLAGLAVLVAVPALGMGLALTFLLFAWLLGLCLLLGHGARRRLAPRLPLTLAERIVLSLTVGYGLLALLVFGLGLSHGLRPPVVALALGPLTVLLAWLERDLLRECCRVRLREWWAEGDLRLPAFVLGLGLLCWPASFWGALLPQTQFDTQTCRLAVPALYCYHGGVVPVPEEFGSYWCNSGEMLFTLGLLLGGHPLATLFHWGAALLLAGSLFCLGRRLAGPSAGWLAALLFYALPLVSLLAESAYNDLFVCLFAFAAFAAVVRWSQEGETQWLTVAGLLLGLAVNCKLNGLIFVLPVLAVVAYGAAVDARRRPGLGRGLVALGLLLAAALAPWRLYAWVDTGNPIFPFANHVFHSPYWKDQYGNMAQWFAGFGVGKGWADFLRLPWDLNFRTVKFGEPNVAAGALGGLSLLGLPVTYWLHARAQRRWLALSLLFLLVGAAAFFRTAQYTRYFLPLYPVLALLAAANVEALWGATVPGWRRGALATAVVVAAGWFFCTRVANLPFGRHYAWRFALGRQSPDSFLAGIPSYDAQRYLATELGPEARVFDACDLGVRLYAVPARVFGIFRTPALREFIHRPSLDDLFRTLRANGVEYLFTDANTLQAGYLASWSWQLVPLYGRKGYFVYRMPPEFPCGASPAAPTVTGFTPTSGPVGTRVVVTGEHLSHVAAVAFGCVPTAGFAVQSPMQLTVTVPAAARSGPVGVGAATGEGASPAVFTVTPGSAADALRPRLAYREGAERCGDNPSVVYIRPQNVAWWRGPLDGRPLHMMGLWARAAAPDQPPAIVTVSWMDAQEKVLAVDQFFVYTGGGWVCRDFPETTYPGATQVEVAVSATGGGLWLEDVRWEALPDPPRPALTLKKGDG